MPSISDFVQPDLRDLSFSLRVVSGDQDALRKINKDFGLSYKFPSAKVSFKEPLMLRIESKYEDSTVVMVENDARTIYSMPAARIKRARDLTHSPGGRQTLLDFGLLSPSLFTRVFDAQFVSADAGKGTTTFDLTFKPSPDYEDASRQRITIDNDRKYIVHREWFGQDGKLRASFDYTQPASVNGHWLATDVVVRNRDGQLAGETKAEAIVVNSDLDLKLFAVN